jgi:hypothetical protein
VNTLRVALNIVLAIGLPRGTRLVPVFLVNRRPADRDHPDLAYAFQVEVEGFEAGGTGTMGGSVGGPHEACAP